jgi:hypothetical protein
MARRARGISSLLTAATPLEPVVADQFEIEQKGGTPAPMSKTRPRRRRLSVVVKPAATSSVYLTPCLNGSS